MTKLAILKTILASLRIHERQLHHDLNCINPDTDREQYHLYKGVKADVSESRRWVKAELTKEVENVSGNKKGD